MERRGFLKGLLGGAAALAVPVTVGGAFVETVKFTNTQIMLNPTGWGYWVRGLAYFRGEPDMYYCFQIDDPKNIEECGIVDLIEKDFVRAFKEKYDTDVKFLWDEHPTEIWP